MNATKRQREILKLLFPLGLSTAAVLEQMKSAGTAISEDTLQREMKILVSSSYVVSEGAGPSRIHNVTTLGRIKSGYSDDEIEHYLGLEDRPICRYEFDAPQAVRDYSRDSRLENNEQEIIDEYRSFVQTLDSTLLRRWRQKWLIEFAWKSSSIEGNTYSELETETLLLDRIAAKGKSHYEATMIINHQTAYDFILDKEHDFKQLKLADILMLHELLVTDLDVSFGLRRGAVRISGSKYVPLSHEQQIGENIEKVISAINMIEGPLNKALTALVLLSYLQPFADGNKRTARLVANAILETYSYPPLILGGIEPTRYRRACIAFYEMNALEPMIAIIHDSYKNFIDFA